MATISSLLTNILQNLFFCVQQKKETHTGLEMMTEFYIILYIVYILFKQYFQYNYSPNSIHLHFTLLISRTDLWVFGQISLKITLFLSLFMYLFIKTAIEIVENGVGCMYSMQSRHHF